MESENVERVAQQLRDLAGNDADDERIDEFLRAQGMVRFHNKLFARSTNCQLETPKLLFQSQNGELTDDALQRIEEQILEPLRHLRVALIVVDFQNDFVCGSLSIKVLLLSH